MMASNNYLRCERAQKRRVLEVHTTNVILEHIQALSVQNTSIQKPLGNFTNAPLTWVMSCDFYKGKLPNGECAIDPLSK